MDFKMDTPIYFPAVDLARGDFIDQRFYGIASLFKRKTDGSIFEDILCGKHNNYPFFLRSLLKPMQASIMADFNTKEYYNYSDEEIAIMQASHAGEKVHTDLVLSILEKAGLNKDYLKCPAIAPLSPDGLKNGDMPEKIHNNCSAKHSMMLAVSKQSGFLLENYTDFNHPLQKLILNKICELSQFENPPKTLDGCTLPVYGLPFLNIAKAFFKLYNDSKYEFLKKAYMENSYIIGGKDASGLRQDTHIMQLNPNLISKTGAGGFLSIYNNKTNEFLLIKMAQDNNKVRFLFTASILKQLNWIDKNPCDYNFYTENNIPAGVYRVNINLQNKSGF